MVLKIYSKLPISDLEIKYIQNIFRESHCPNESLKLTLNGRFPILTKDNILYLDNLSNKDTATHLLELTV